MLHSRPAPLSYLFLSRPRFSSHRFSCLVALILVLRRPRFYSIASLEFVILLLASIASLLSHSYASRRFSLIRVLAKIRYASRPAPAPAPAPSLPPYLLAIRFIRFAFLHSNNYSLLYTPTPLAALVLHYLLTYSLFDSFASIINRCASYYLRTRSFHSIRFAFSAPTPLIYRLSSNINSFNPFASNRLILLF